MFHKIIIAAIFASVQFQVLAAQNLAKSHRDSLLNYFVENKTYYNPADPAPSSTDYEGTRQSFPWLYHDQKQWENLSAYLDDPYFKDIHERNLQALKDIEGGLPAGQTNPRVLKKWLERATVAWYITGEPQYLEIAKQALLASCRSDQWKPYPPGRYHINSADLSTGELMFNVSFGYDALYPYLDEPQKDECMKVLIEKGLRAYLEGYVKRDWWVNCDFNWNSALHGNAGLAAMVIRNANPALSDLVLGLATEGLPYMIQSFYPGGGYIEGVMYQGTAIGHLTDFIVPYYKLTGEDLGLLENEDFHQTLTFWIPMFAPDGRAYNFSDCNEQGSLYGISQGFWWAHQLDHPEWAWDQERRASKGIGRGGLFHDVESFWYRQPQQESRPMEIPRLWHFKGIDWAVWHGENSWLAFRGGFNGGNHDNDDLGNLILGYGRDRFLIDPGYGANKASEHNCITVRGHEQSDCAKSYIRQAFEHKDGFYLRCDIREAFPHAVSHYNRHLLMIDDSHLLLIDDLEGAEGRRLWVNGHIQTRYPVERTGKGWEIHGSNDTCRIDLLFESGPQSEVEWDFRGPITRLVYKDLADREHVVQPVLFSFKDDPFAYQYTANGFSLQINGKIYEFRQEDGELRLLFNAVAVNLPDIQHHR
jgi:hypothetical protein